MKVLQVVAAVLVCQGQILCMQRGPAKYDYVAYKYEFPGGKIEAGEKPQEALERELKEEMDLNIKIKEQELFMEVNHTYPDFAIHMYCYKCQVQDKGFKLKEHKSFRWLHRKELEALDWLPADRPIVEKLAKG